MPDIAQLLGEFIDDWNAGRRPDVTKTLNKAAPSDRDKLADLLMTWLRIAPTPMYDEATLEEIRNEPVLKAALKKLEELG